jgi:hypothetical protein
LANEKQIKNRIIILSSAIFILMATALVLLFLPSAEVDPVRDETDRMIRRFENREVREFAGHFSYPLDITIFGDSSQYSGADLRLRLNELYGAYSSISVDPGEMVIERTSDGMGAVVQFSFDCTAIPRFDGGMPRYSRRKGNATLRFANSGGEWKIIEVQLRFP